MSSFLIFAEYCFYASTLGIIIYYKFIFDKIADFRPFKNKNTPPVSVIICAKNELLNLQNNLPLFLHQKYPDFEVLVVDDNSTDGSMTWLEQEAIKHSNLKVISFTKEKVSGGKKEVLSYGISQAKNEFLLLSDADCHPSSPVWIKQMLQSFGNNTELVLGIGMYRKTKSLVNKFIQFDTIMICIQYLSFAVVGKPYMSVGRNVAYKKSLFLKNNGFSSHLDIKSGDDDLFVQEAATSYNTSIALGPLAQTISEPEKTWAKLIRQKTRHHSTGSSYRKETIILLGIFQLLILLFYSTFILLIVSSHALLSLLTIFFLKNLVQATIFRRIFVKIGVRERIVPFLIFDAFWVMFLTYINVRNLTSKNKQW